MENMMVAIEQMRLEQYKAVEEIALQKAASFEQKRDAVGYIITQQSRDKTLQQIKEYYDMILLQFPNLFYEDDIALLITKSFGLIAYDLLDSDKGFILQYKPFAEIVGNLSTLRSDFVINYFDGENMYQYTVSELQKMILSATG